MSIAALSKVDRLTTNRGAAIAVWLLGCFTTASFVGQLGVSSPLSYVIGAAVQFLLTKAESPLWRSQERTKLSIAAVVFDSAFNAAGVWPYLANLGGTAFWLMLSEWMGSNGPPTLITKIVIAVIAGIATAAAPELLWEQED